MMYLKNKVKSQNGSRTGSEWRLWQKWYSMEKMKRWFDAIGHVGSSIMNKASVKDSRKQSEANFFKSLPGNKASVTPSQTDILFK